MDHQNVIAEQMLLACVLADNTVIKEIELSPEQFSPHHAPVFKAMRELDADDSLIDMAALHMKLGTAMGQVNLKEAVDSLLTTESYKHYENTIIRAWKRKEARLKTQEYLQATNDTGTEEGLSELISQLSSLEQAGIQSDEFDTRTELMAIYDEAYDGVVQKGLPTGFVEYDRMTNGHDEGQLIIVAARPSVGKTAFALNVAMGHMKQGAFGHLYSLEMSKKSFLKRMWSANAHIDSQKMRDPHRLFSENDWKKFNNGMSEISELDMYIGDNSSVTIPQIYARTRKLMRKYPDKKHFVMIDYLQLLKPIAKRGNRQEEVSEMSRALKTMARDLGIPVIALSQLSRGVESRQDKRPMLSDIRESGAIEQDADLIAFLYRDDYYDKESENKNTIEIIIGKQREGPVGTVELAFVKEYNLFVNLDRRYEDDRPRAV
ncbi:replicative DNA helicase [Shouchella miscanthi]|uniref:replicative DNA helicase n=1 Tax=Shouchella miscanthi TaxID=2598861 RepID=UPI0011A5C7AF|nr:replicative DNA helicase [Shouchella miscanthi]